MPDSTAIVAWYAALIATVVLLWDIGKWKADSKNQEKRDEERMRDRKEDRIRRDRTILSKLEMLDFPPPSVADTNKRGEARRRLESIDNTTSDAADPIRHRWKKVKQEVRNATPEAASKMLRDLLDDVRGFTAERPDS